MRKLGFAIGLVAVCCLVASAGTLQAHQVGKPTRAHDLGAPTPVQSQTASVDRVWEFRQGPTVDFVTGQVVSGDTRVATTIFDNTTNSTGYYSHGPATTIRGDMLGMVNGGTVSKLTVAVYNGDTVNKMTKVAIRLVYLTGPSNAPAITRDITSSQIDLTTAYPGGMASGQGIAIGLDLTTLSPPLILPGLAYIGQETVNMTGTPAAPTDTGWGIYTPPTIGSSTDRFWDWTLDGTGVYTGNWFYNGSPFANHYYKVEVDPVQWTPPPIYDNTVTSLNYYSAYPAEAIFADDLIMANTPAGEFLNRIDFSIANGSTSVALNSLDVDIVLRDWNPASSAYYLESDPVHAVTFAITGLAFSPALPPNYVSFWYVEGLASLNVSVANNILAGLRFRNMAPATVTSIGQAMYNPPDKGGSNDDFWIAGYPGLTDGWYWFGGDPWSAFYWGIATGVASPCLADGDMNCDGAINSQDIDGFVYALFSLASQYNTYLHSFPVFHDCLMSCGDFTGDGTVNSQDIDGFIAALFGH